MSNIKDRLGEKLDEAVIPPSYFHGHECHLAADKLSTVSIKCSRWRRFLFDLTTVRSDDIRARNMFKSYASLRAEKYRHYIHYPLSIHPFSMLRLWLEIIFVSSILLSNTMLTIHYSEDLTDMDYHLIVMYISDGLIMLNILANCFTGYVESKPVKHVVLDLKKVFCKYTRTWLIVDLLSAMSFLPVLLKIESITPHLVLLAMRIFRLPILFLYLSNIMEAFRCKVQLRTCINNSLYVFSYIMWNIYFQFASEYITEGSYKPANPRQCSWLTMGKLWNASTTGRFFYSMERAISMLRNNSNLTLTTRDGCLEGFYVLSWLIAKILIYHCGLKYTIATFGQESAAAKYFTMTRQVEMYMNQRKLPPRIKKKILKFYAIRYQRCFFVEAPILSCVYGQLCEDIIMHIARQLVRELVFLKNTAEAPILSCVSGQLREDIIMHTGRQLVRELEFLKQLPRTLLLQIGFKLKLVIFIAGDIIYKINTVGDSLYFIDKGTVAIYSESGKEVCHLEDGDFFGEIALVMKHRFRTTSVVAVTNCELFRLDREDFNSSIACYPSVYEHIKKVAAHRQERTSVLDEYHKTEMRNFQSYSKE